jgi:flagellar protein FliO/FliZ
MLPGWSSLLWFAAVLALIPAALWLLKRTPLAGQGRAGTPRLVALLPLSAQHKLVTVEVGQGEDRLWLVLGVAPQGIRTLHTLLPQTEPAAAAATAPQATFAQLLTRLRGGAAGSPPAGTAPGPDHGAQP